MGTDCDLYIDWHTGSDGNAITDAIAAGSCRPTSPDNTVEAYPGATLNAMFIETDSACPISGLVTCDGVEYDIGDVTQGARYLHTSNYEDIVSADCAENIGVMSMGFLFKTNMNGDYTWHADSSMNGSGEWCVLAPRYFDSQQHLYLHANSGYSATAVNIDNDTWYWVTMQYNRTTKYNSLAVYLASTMEQVGSTITLALVASPPYLDYWTIGQSSQGGNTESGKYTWYGPAIFDWTDGTFPLLPEAPDTDVTLPITGVSGSASVGAVVLSVFLSLAGLLGTTGVGTLAPPFTVALSGVSSGMTYPVSGVEATGEVGTVTAEFGVGADVTLPVTGVGVTGDVGTMALGGTDMPITGNEGTGDVGNATPVAAADVMLPITGEGATAEVGEVFYFVGLGAMEGETGDLGLDIAPPLTGIEATGAIESPGPDRAVILNGAAAVGEAGGFVNTFRPLTGAEATGEVGTLSPRVSSAISNWVWGMGNMAAGRIGSVVQSRSVAFTGVTGTGRVGYLDTLVAGDLVLPLTGVYATGRAGTATCLTASPNYVHVKPRKRILTVTPRHRIITVSRRRF